MGKLKGGLTCLLLQNLPQASREEKPEGSLPLHECVHSSITAETKDAPKADLAIAPTRDLGHDKTEELAPTHMIARRLLG